jgi:predicted DNA-binding protein (MmcQ/YjbR family)
MNIDSVREFCLAFPETTERLQWGETLVFKVRGKIFAMLSLETAQDSRLILKCTPELFAQLIEREGIAPSPYVGRYHWVALERLDVVRDGELRDLIQRSYELVESKAPKKKGRSEKRDGGRRKASGARKGH